MTATKAACVGDNYKNVRRSDGTLFRNPGECIKYVATGAPLRPRPRMVIDVYYRDEDHCEFGVELHGIPPSISVPVSIVHPFDGLTHTLDAQIGTDGTTSNATGGYGVAFSIPIKHTITVTANFTDLGSPAVLTQDVRC